MTALTYHVLLDLDGEKWIHPTATTSILSVHRYLRRVK